MLTALIPAVTELASGYLSNRKEKAIDSSVNSLNDEAWTITFTVIIAAAMVPDLQPYIKEGFRVLKDDCPIDRNPVLPI